MQPIRREILTWNDVDHLIDHLIPQFDVEFGGMVVITRGGIIPGGLLAQCLDMKRILIAAVDFPEVGQPLSTLITKNREIDPGLYAWPVFLQFPEKQLVEDNKILIVDDVWGSGRTIMAVRSRVASGGGTPYTCVLHFNPNVNRFKNIRPDYFAATTDAYIVYPWELSRGIDKVMPTGFGKE